MCGSVLATWEALLRQNLARAVPARCSTGNPSHTLPYTSKALGYDHSFHLSNVYYCATSLAYVREEAGSSSTAFSTYARRLLNVCWLVVPTSLLGLCKYMGPPAHGAELHITAHHPYLSIYLYLSIYVYASVEPFLYAKLVLEQHQWGVSGLAHRLISDGSH